MKEQIAQQCRDAVAELYEVAHLKAGDILVVGCSTSEVLGSKIGTNSAPETAVEIFNSLYGFLKEKGVYLAAQCCEHLNRAIIVEAEAVPNADIVNVVPQPKAGGSFATAAYHGLEHPVAVEEIKADAGRHPHWDAPEKGGRSRPLAGQADRSGTADRRSCAAEVHRRRESNLRPDYVIKNSKRRVRSRTSFCLPPGRFHGRIEEKQGKVGKG